MAGALTFDLPEAPPTHYLTWLRIWREVEQRMIENPALEALASSESAPFVREAFADMISGGLVPEIVRQAETALARGERVVRPRLEVDPDQLAKVITYVSRRAAWLSRRGVTEALGVEFPPEATALRDRVVAGALELLRASGHDRAEEGP